MSGAPTQTEYACATASLVAARLLWLCVVGKYNSPRQNQRKCSRIRAERNVEAQSDHWVLVNDKALDKAHREHRGKSTYLWMPVDDIHTTAVKANKAHKLPFILSCSVA